MGNRKKNCFFNKVATTTLLALLLCTRGMYKCLVTGSLGTGFLKSFLLTVLLGFLGPTNLVWGIGKKTVFSIS